MSSISTIRRQVKNVACNFSDAQVKVREATSNDPWGPSTALMSEIADLTHNQNSFTEVMSMLWKRLNDHGKNWRHVYKSLVLLDYLIKCGSDKVAQQCRENIYSIETLKDFQHIEENRDLGMTVREKAKQIVGLLYDEERLKNERTKFQMTRKKFMSGTAISSDGTVGPTRKFYTGPLFDSELEDARPANAGEEEEQLQLALTLSREENEKEEELRQREDIGLQMAITESKREVERMNSLDSVQHHTVLGAALSKSAIDDLLSLAVSQPVEETLQNPWGSPAPDPWDPSPSTAVGTGLPVADSQNVVRTTNDPWTMSSTVTMATLGDLWEGECSSLEPTPLLVPTKEDVNTSKGSYAKTPESFLGDNCALVNLDNLMGTTTITSNSTRSASNPFLSSYVSASSLAPTNPFTAQHRPSPSLNEIINRGHSASGPFHSALFPSPATSVCLNQQQPARNPFLL